MESDNMKVMGTLNKEIVDFEVHKESSRNNQVLIVEVDDIEIRLPVRGDFKGMLLELGLFESEEKPIYSGKFKIGGWFDADGKPVSEEVESELNKLLAVGDKPNEDIVEIPYFKEGL